jgi:LPXTG-motif cell wall-anchored protein
VDETGTPITGETPVEQSVDSQGKLVFTGLTAGRYMLEEITVPTGYAKTETVHYIDVEMNGNSGLPTGIEYKLITETEDNVYKVENEPLNVPVRFLKIDQDGKPLAGAKFSLYKDAYDASGTPEAEAANQNHLVQKDLISHLVGEGDNQVAEIAMKDLNPGTYYLVETEAPNGYYNNGIIKIVVAVTTTVSDGNTNDTVSVTAELAGNPVNDPRDFYMTDDGTYVLRVMNTQGYELPHTGGNGTAAIYLAGLMLVLLSGMLYSRRKRLAMSGHGISESERSGEEGGGARL